MSSFKLTAVLVLFVVLIVGVFAVNVDESSPTPTSNPYGVWAQNDWVPGDGELAAAAICQLGGGTWRNGGCYVKECRFVTGAPGAGLRQICEWVRI